MFQHVEFYPGDPILGLVETFNNDSRAEKVNLGIGIYFDANGKLLGVMDMAGPKEMAYPHTLGMVVAATKAISRQLCIAESNRQVDLTNHYLSTVIDSMTDGVVAVDVKGKIIGINSQGAKILKTTTFESYGKNILEIMDGETILDHNGNVPSSLEEKDKHITTKSKKINCLI